MDLIVVSRCFLSSPSPCGERRRGGWSSGPGMSTTPRPPPPTPPHKGEGRSNRYDKSAHVVPAGDVDRLTSDIAEVSPCQGHHDVGHLAGRAGAPQRDLIVGTAARELMLAFRGILVGLDAP